MLLWFLIFLLAVTETQGETETECDVSSEEKNKTVKAVVGQDAILPCFLNSSHNQNTLQWGKGNEDIYSIPAVSTPNSKMSVSDEEFQKGNASLKLFNVTKLEEGQYCCCFNPGSESQRKCFYMTLVVEENSGNQNNNRDSNKGITAPPPSTPDPDDSLTTRHTIGVSVGVACVVVVVVVVVVVLTIWFCKKHQSQQQQGRRQSQHDEQAGEALNQGQHGEIQMNEIHQHDQQENEHMNQDPPEAREIN